MDKDVKRPVEEKTESFVRQKLAQYAVQEGVLEKLMADIRTARLQNYPFILLDTMELEVIRDVAYHPENPVGHVRAGHLGAMDLLSGEEEAHFDDCVNVIWYDFSDRPDLASDQGYDWKNSAAVIVMCVRPKNNGGAAKQDADQEAFLRSFLLRHLLQKKSASYVLMYGSASLLPEDLKYYTKVLDVPFPSVQELCRRIWQQLARANVPEIYSGSTEVQETLEHIVLDIAQGMRGLTYVEAERLTAYLLEEYVQGKPLFFAGEKAWRSVIERHKQQSLKSNGDLLELQKEKKRFISGMGQLQQWIDDNQYRVTPKHAHQIMVQVGVSAPKGTLLHGTPGCGKSDVAFMLQQKWNLPLLKMDMGRLMGNLLGMSEERMRKALKQAEACSPCILWIDEIEKALSGMSGGPNSSDSVRRMISHLLFWLSDDRGEDACFVYCTANSLEGLPKELYRVGRLDILFSVTLPTKAECVDIFMAQLENKRITAENSRVQDGEQVENYQIFRCTEPDWEKIWKNKIGFLLDGNGDMSTPSLLYPHREQHAPLFVAGSDITEIVRLALLKCEKEKKNDAPLDIDQFIKSAREVIQSPTMNATGYGEGNLKALAEGYVRTMQGSFVPVSGEDQVMFTPDDYSTVDEERNGLRRTWVKIKETSVRRQKYLSDDAQVSAYDRALYKTLLEHIEKLPAPQMEK